MELTVAERRIIGRKATKRIVSKITAMKRKAEGQPTLLEAYNLLVEQWYAMIDNLNGGGR